MLDIKKILSKFQQLKVLVIGDVMIDRYLYGTINRISPEAPVPIVLMNNSENRLGGAANVALNIKALGATPFLCSVIGSGESGKKFLQLMKEKEIVTQYLFTSKYRKTTTKTRILAQNQQVLRLDDEDTIDLIESESAAFLQLIKEVLDNNKIDVILFQDYNKGVLSSATIPKILKEANNRAIPTAVDPKNKNFYSYYGVTLFKPNLREINTNLPFQSRTELNDLIAAKDYLSKKINNRYTLITLSEKGIFYSDKHNSNILPTIPRIIADVCGAGDSVISVAALGLAINIPLSDIAQLSNLAGGQVCEKVGVVSVSPEQLVKEIIGSFGDYF